MRKNIICSIVVVIVLTMLSGCGNKEEFVCGMDTSAVLALENSGVRYYNFNGEESDVFKTLSEAGVDYIRLRVWNDPYDANGNGYGGGNNDVPTAIELGKRASEQGMKVCVDFHYSDFWADPKRQHAPKAWKEMNVSEKSEALYDFTVDSLSELLDAGVDVGMVQIGNEINNGMCDVSFLPDVTELLDAGSAAVRYVSKEYNKPIKIIVHYTDINSAGKVDSLVSNIVKQGLDFDIIGLSYYPFWHGSIQNMSATISRLRETYDKDVIIVETSYVYTSEDYDGTANSVKGKGDIVKEYPATVEGQAGMIREIIREAKAAGALGVFYWEGTWIPVGSDKKENTKLWETYGSGWASSFAADYDPEDAGLYYGGCSWENQAMFDSEGYPLESLKVFNEF